MKKAVVQFVRGPPRQLEFPLAYVKENTTRRRYLKRRYSHANATCFWVLGRKRHAMLGSPSHARVII